MRKFIFRKLGAATVAFVITKAFVRALFQPAYKGHYESQERY